MPFRPKNPKRLRGKGKPTLYIADILAWADEHKERTGRFPVAKSGPIQRVPGQTWMAVQVALHNGLRGLPGGSSLAKLLAKHRGARNRTSIPALSEKQILRWADRHKSRTGNWPIIASGPIVESPGDTWLAVEHALRAGSRGLRGGLTLARLLEKQRGVRRHVRHPPLDTQQILEWADAHKRRTGQWPIPASGSIAGAGGETWRSVHAALVQGKRGLPGGSSLAGLLAKHRGVRRRGHLPSLSVRLILKWIAEHDRLHGRYPNEDSGGIADSGGETWAGVNRVLFVGERGLPGGSSLARLLAKHFGVRNMHDLPTLTEQQIVDWIAKHRRRHQTFPTSKSGAIPGSGGETWGAIENALRQAGRGLRGGSSLARLIRKHFLAPKAKTAGNRTKTCFDVDARSHDVASHFRQLIAPTPEAVTDVGGLESLRDACVDFFVDRWRRPFGQFLSLVEGISPANGWEPCRVPYQPQRSGEAPQPLGFGPVSPWGHSMWTTIRVFRGVGAVLLDKRSGATMVYQWCASTETVSDKKLR